MTSDFLSYLAQGLLIIALPIVIAAAIQHLRVMTNRLKADMSQERQETIDWAVRVGVQFAERVGLIEKLISSEKRKRAIEVAQKFLADRGVGPVTGMNDRFIGQAEQVLPYSFNQSIKITSGQVSPAD